MGKRREARERAVQFLFQFDLNPVENLDEALEHFWASHRLNAAEAKLDKATWGEQIHLDPPSADEAAVRLFAEPLIRGVLDHRDDLDAQIKKVAEHWDLH